MSNEPKQKQSVGRHDIVEFSRSIEAFGRTIDRLGESQELQEERYLELNRRLESVNERLRELLEDNIRNSDFLQLAVDRLDGALIAVDAEGLVRVYNSAAAELLGFSQDKVIGRKYQDIWPNDSAEDSAYLALLRGSGAQHKRLRKVKSDGTKTLVRSRTFVFRENQSESGKKLGAVEMFDELTANAPETSDSRIKTLAALGEMAATVAHEIRTPLAGIMGFADLLLRDLPQDDPRHRHAERVVTGVERLNSLVERLLDYARDDRPEWQRIDWTHLLRSVLNSFEEDGKHRGSCIKLIRKVPEHMGEGRGDPVFLQQAMINVLHNARDALEGRENALVTVSAVRTADGGVEVHIADNGCGIPEGIQTDVFRPFFTTRRKGTGLGLATCRKILEAHGGTIRLESTPNLGTQVSLSIPGGPPVDPAATSNNPTSRDVLRNESV